MKRAGLAVGLIGLFIVAVWWIIPNWQHQRREERARKILETLTPETAISRCGNPESDTVDRTDELTIRQMTYGLVTLNFVTLKGDTPSNPGFRSRSLDDAATNTDRLYSLPCLVPK